MLVPLSEYDWLLVFAEALGICVCVLTSNRNLRIKCHLQLNRIVTIVS